MEECTKKLYVETSTKMDFKDGLNRDYREVFDKINRSDILGSRYKNQMLKYYLNGIIHSFPQDVAFKYYNSFINNINDNDLLESLKIQHQLFLYSVNTTDKKELINSEKISINFKNLISQNKITYIDFWASWCGPCRAEIPNSQKLRLEYEKKGITFLYISTDTDFSAWEMGNKQYNFDLKNSFILPNGNDSPLAKQFNLKTIPRYILIGKDGKVINQDAPRPSNSKIRKVFDDLLREK
jgi:thiol-disulfide isomerase/thioredoxin